MIDERGTWCWTLLGAAAVLAAGCGGYEGLGPTGYEYAKALYSITNRQDGEALDSVLLKIDASVQAGDLTPTEADWLRDVIDDAAEGDWQAANSAARRMMEDQVTR